MNEAGQHAGDAGTLETESHRLYIDWREAEKRAGREFRADTKSARKRLEEALAAAEKVESDSKAQARVALREAGRKHRQLVEVAQAAYRKALAIAEATLKEERRKANAELRAATEKYDSLVRAASLVRRNAENAAEGEFKHVTAPAYAKRKETKQVAFKAYAEAVEREAKAEQPNP
jgi:hypothetical protein